MAHIRKRPRKGGSITYTVRWIQDGSEETETFNDEADAEVFKALVKQAGEKWPKGWVRGVGFPEPEPDEPTEDPRAALPVTEWAHRVVDKINGIEKRTRADYKRDIDRHFTPLVHTDFDGTIHPATVVNVIADDIGDWVRTQEEGEPDPERKGKWLRQPAKPKSIANHHSLLYAIFQAAVEAEPPIRSTNPCAKTQLPRADDQIEEEMVFLEHDEYQRIRAEVAKICGGDAVPLADWLVGTGMRWGEATALQVRDFNLRGANPTVKVQRAWKRQDDGTFKLGPPKTKKSRRTLALTAEQVADVTPLLAGKAPEDHVFLTTLNKVWRHSNFYYRRWTPAVSEAIRKGFPKRPRLHDLRHTHVAWLIAKNIPLPAIQARLGHESITTTVDRYGHLVRSLDQDIVAAVSAAMVSQSPTGLHLVGAGA